MRNFSKLISVLLTLVLSLSPALTPLAQAQSRDITPPKVQHEPDTNEIPSDQPYVISATVTDEIGVGKVTLFFRQVGSSIFNSVEMEATGSQGIYVTEISPEELTPPGLEYYIQAEDIAGNTLLRGFTFEPLVLKIGEGTSGSALAKTSTDSSTSSRSSSNKWLWIGLSVLAVGGIAAAAGGGGGGGGGGSDDPTVTVNAPIPQ